MQTYIVRFCKPTTKHVLCRFNATAKAPEIVARFAVDWAAQATTQPYDLYVDVTNDNTDALDLSIWN